MRLVLCLLCRNQNPCPWSCSWCANTQLRPWPLCDAHPRFWRSPVTQRQHKTYKSKPIVSWAYSVTHHIYVILRNHMSSHNCPFVLDSIYMCINRVAVVRERRPKRQQFIRRSSGDCNRLFIFQRPRLERNIFVCSQKRRKHRIQWWKNHQTAHRVWRRPLYIYMWSYCQYGWANFFSAIFLVCLYRQRRTDGWTHGHEGTTICAKCAKVCFFLLSSSSLSSLIDIIDLQRFVKVRRAAVLKCASLGMGRWVSGGGGIRGWTYWV